MLVTQREARALITRHYPGMSFRLTTSCAIGVRPVYETQCGAVTLCWRKLAADRPGDIASAVRIGCLLPGGAINWNWEEAQS